MNDSSVWSVAVFGLVFETPQQHRLIVGRVLEQFHRLVAVAGKHDLVEAPRLATVEHDLRLVFPAAHRLYRSLEFHGLAIRRGERPDVAPRAIDNGEPWVLRVEAEEAVIMPKPKSVTAGKSSILSGGVVHTAAAIGTR